MDMPKNLRMTGAVAASDAARVLSDPAATADERSAAASALSQAADKPAHHARLIRPFTYWFVLRRARRAAARRTFTRGSADFARARVLAALDLLSWLDHRGQVLRDLTRADLDQWLADGTTTSRAVRCFLQWARGRGQAGDVYRTARHQRRPRNTARSE